MLSIAPYVIFVTGVYGFKPTPVPMLNHRFKDHKEYDVRVSSAYVNYFESIESTEAYLRDREANDPYDVSVDEGIKIPNERIKGGEEVDIKEYPFQAAVLYKGFLRCGGTIISEQYVLTASQCVYRLNADDMSVKVGTSAFKKGGQLYQLESFINQDHRHRDVALLKTIERMVLDGVTTAVVKLPEQGSSLPVGSSIVVTGWGWTSVFPRVSDVLRAMTLPIVPLSKCNVTADDMLENVFCAATEAGNGPCLLDTGGPALAADSGVQHGIVSYGGYCMFGRPAIYSNVGSYRDWIRENAGV